MDLSLQSINLNKAQTPSQGVKNDANFSDKTSQKTDNIVVKFFKWAGLTLKLKSLERQEKKLKNTMADAGMNSKFEKFRKSSEALGRVQNKIVSLEKVLANYWRT